MEIDIKKKKKGGGFQSMGLSTSVYRGIMSMGYNLPTPIQRKAIPFILQGNDLVGMARTGSGKTAAFMIPIIDKLKQHSTVVGSRALVLSPTRELAMQTAEFTRKLSKYTDIRQCVLVGGYAIEKQFSKLASNPDIIIATPGRLSAHISEVKEFDLSAIVITVIDEADRLFEMGFQTQLEEIFKSININRQLVLMSATLPSQLVEFTRVGLREPVFVRLDVEKTLSENLKLYFFYTRPDEKVATALFYLRRLVVKGENVLMFVATRHHVEFFAYLLNSAGVAASCVHGSLDQVGRNNALALFKSRKTRVLVVTDVAARGLDLPSLDNVLNYDFPSSAKLFVHRVGRTARAGKDGSAASLVSYAELPYAMELLLFLGVSVNHSNNTVESINKTSGGEYLNNNENNNNERILKDDDGDSSSVKIGGIPRQLLVDDIDCVQLQLTRDCELVSLHRSMCVSYGPYHRTRQPASKQSVSKAKLLLSQCGGAQRLGETVHPSFYASCQVKEEEERVQLISQFRSFRPTVNKKARSSVVPPLPNAHTHRKNALRLGIHDTNTYTHTHTHTHTPELGCGLLTSNAPVDIFNSRTFADKDNWLGYSIEPTDDVWKERALEMEGATLDLLGDDENELKRQNFVKKWNAKRKKYEMLPLDKEGRPLTAAKRRKNESGVMVVGDRVRTGVYKKWATDAHTRIQRAGETEAQPHTHTQNKRKLHTDDTHTHTHTQLTQRKICQNLKE
eukprot:GHVR01054797.1.p1 GENE.GHVR01054797.1~~GHVR01054797.1.p1  ORF type:complete len:734 (-),score=258.57 GHVR01054797.1:197-2398(-)